MAGTGCHHKDSGPDVLARIGDTVITAAELEQELAYRRENARPMVDPEDLLDEMILHRQALLRARRIGLDQDPDVRRELDNLLVARLRDRELDRQITSIEIPEEELEAEYQRRLNTYTKPAKSRLAILFLETPGHMSEGRHQELQKRMAEARTRALEQPKPTGRGPAAQGFGALAIEYSDHQASRYRGGDIGWLDHGSVEYPWPREVLETGYALEPGQISPWIETDRGCYLVTRTDFREATTLPFEQAKPGLRNGLMAAKRKAAQEAFRDATAEMFPAEINTNALAALASSPDTSATFTQNRESTPPATPGITPSTHAN